MNMNRTAFVFDSSICLTSWKGLWRIVSNWSCSCRGQSKKDPGWSVFYTWDAKQGHQEVFGRVENESLSCQVYHYYSHEWNWLKMTVWGLTSLQYHDRSKPLGCEGRKKLKLKDKTLNFVVDAVCHLFTSQTELGQDDLDNIASVGSNFVKLTFFALCQNCKADLLNMANMSTYKQMLQRIDRRNRLRWTAIWPTASEIESAGRLFLSDVLEETILCRQQ